MMNKDRTENQEKGDQSWDLTRLSQTLLTANTLEELLSASLEVIIPTDVDGVTILLADGPPDELCLEVAAGWERDGEPILPPGTRLGTREYQLQPFLGSGRPVVIDDVAVDERVSAPLRSLLHQAAVGTLVALPLGSEQDYRGAIFIVRVRGAERAERQPFSSECLQLYAVLTALVTSAIEKLRFIQETKQTLAETEALYKVSRHLSACQSINDILLTVLDSELFGAAGGSIALLEPSASEDAADQELVFWAAAGAGSEDILGMHMPVSEGVVGWVVREGQSALVPDAYTDERFYRQMDAEIEFRTQSILCAPLRVEGQVIGAISLVDVRQAYLTAEGLHLLDQVADQAALRIQNQRLLIETRRQAHELEALLDIGRDLSSTLDREEALELITSRTLDLVAGDGCRIYLLQPDQQLLVPVASSDQYAAQILGAALEVGQGISGRVVQSGVGVIANRVDLDPRAFLVPGTPPDPESLISVPLFSKNQVIGVMTLSRLGEEGFVENDLRLVLAVASYANTLLENTRLFQETQQRSEELAALNAVVSTASQSLTLEEILVATLERVSDVTPGHAGLICLRDPETGELHLATPHNMPESLVQRLREQGMHATLCAITVQQGQTYSVPDLTADVPVDTSALTELGLRSYLGTPLVARGRVLGTLSLFSSEPNAFDAADASLLTAVGQQVGIAVRNARLYEQMERALDESEALYETSQAMADTMELEDVLQILVSRMAEYVGADQCRFILFNEALGYGQVMAEHHPTPDIENLRIPMAGNPSYEVLRDTGQAVAIENVLTHPITAEVRETLAGYGAKSMLLVPLIARGRLIGSIGLDSTQTYRTFSESEINFCRTLADRAALALENRRLFAQTQHTLDETTMLYEASRALTQTREIQEVLQAITDNLPIKEVDQCLIALAEPGSDPDNPSIEIAAMWDHEGDDGLLGTHLTSRELPFLNQPGVTKTWIVNDLENEPHFDSQSVATLQALGVKSALFVPLMTGGELLGWLLLVTHHQTHLFDPEHVRPYQILADQAAVAIQNQQLLKKVRDSLEEVKAVHRQYLREEWTTFLQTQEKGSTAITYDRGKLLSVQDLWHPLISKAISQGTAVAHSGDGDPAAHPGEDADVEESLPGGASMVTPLQVRDQIIGTIGLEDPEQAREWTMDELSMIQEIADQVALAIENARLIETTQTSLAETERLYQTTGRLSNADSVDEILNILIQEVQTALGPTFSGSILRAGPDPASRIDWLEVSAQWNTPESTIPVGVRRPVSDFPLLQRFVGHREPFIIRDTEIAPTDEQTREHMAQTGARTITAVPLITGESWLGLIDITCQEDRTPDERTMRFLRNLSDRAAVALESSRLYEEIQQHAIQLEAATKVSRAATSILERDTLLPSVVELIRDHFNYYHAQVFLLDPTRRWAILEASSGEIGRQLLKRGHTLEVGSPSIIGYVTSSGEHRITRDVDKDAIYFKNELLPDTRSEMAIPLRIGERVYGALDIQSTEPDAFSPDEVAVLSTLADQLAVALENARLYQEQLATAEKLREVDQIKTQFMANMSHELRTPLNSIIGFSRVILKGIDGPLTDLQKQDLSAIYSSGQHLLGLINDILDLSKIEAGKMELVFEETNVEEIITGVMSTAVGLFKEKPEVKIRHSIAPDMPLIMADSTRVRQILLNLINNASKFTAKGYVNLTTGYDERYVTVKVSDSGIGIPADKFEVIFKEFEQADSSTTRAYGGTGLGLPISKLLVEMHGGRIWVESEVGVGSTFTVQLPIKGPQAEEEEAAEFVLDPQRQLILVVDDDADVIKMYERYLGKLGYQVFGLLESEQALAKARQWQPYAILLDLLMPRKDGWAVIKELKADPDTQDIPVVVCSIVSETGRGFSLGAADYLVKPILAQQLVSALARLGDSMGHTLAEAQRVLIIDDTPEDRRLLRRTLESASETHQILEASSGPEGIEIIQQQQPDLVVLDLMMPDMDGFAVLEALKSDPDMRQIPIIIVTAKELTKQEHTQISGQVAALFQKGLFKEDELLQDVDRVLRQMRKQTPREEQTEA